MVSISSKGHVLGNRRQVRRPAADDDRVPEHAQLVDEAELDGRGGQAGAADGDVGGACLERRRDLLRHWRGS